MRMSCEVNPRVIQLLVLMWIISESCGVLWQLASLEISIIDIPFTSLHTISIVLQFLLHCNPLFLLCYSFTNYNVFVHSMVSQLVASTGMASTKILLAGAQRLTLNLSISIQY